MYYYKVEMSSGGDHKVVVNNKMKSKPDHAIHVIASGTAAKISFQHPCYFLRFLI